ncbi:uncharacterized protein LOC123660924 [Melitaea cinxia]|uniref:uncharacterized protein LOC123660924 n=1 Tax=Melitaea cinxia TaxID=113334 RepID=UPI001E271824|nr:uncharacterized protein LOC123660924 [Melitaea cinxia]
MQEACALTETGSVTIQDKDLSIFVAFAALTLASEIEENEQKKRGAGKANVLNAIPTGAQKTDYPYSVYSQTSSPQNPGQSYQSQVPNSFYPSQSPSQYFTSNNPEIPVSNGLPTHASPQTTQSQFVPINFIPNPGYQSKYQVIPQKPNVQVAILQQPSISHTPMLQYPHTFYSPSPVNHIGQSPVFGLGQSHFSFGPSIHPLPFSGHILSQQPTMVVLPQSNPSLYNNLVYPNPTQSFYNYYPLHSQAKYSYTSGAPQSNEYEKLQTSVQESFLKEDRVNVQSPDYVTTSDSNSAYKNTYNNRNTYTKN